jgi:polyhydroxyalkanoate synthesis repressor PhaR
VATHPKRKGAGKTTTGKEAGRPRRRGRPPRHEAPTPDLSGARLIKRYGNRRLYDHTLSRPVTMEELAEAVQNGVDFRVLDGDSGRDITQRILVQIILEQQNRHQLELLPVEFLRQLIQVRSEPLGQWMSQYLAAGAQWLGRQMNAATPAMRNVQESLSGLFSWMQGPGASSAPPQPSPYVAPEPARDPGRERAPKRPRSRPHSRPHSRPRSRPRSREEERELAEEIGGLQERLAELARRVNQR